MFTILKNSFISDYSVTGNSAFETAQNLQGATNVIHLMSRHRVRFSWETHYVGDVRFVSVLELFFFSNNMIL